MLLFARRAEDTVYLFLILRKSYGGNVRMRVVRYRVAIVVCLLSALMPLGVYADQIVSVRTSFPPTVPLLITAYEMKPGGVDVALIEVYNTSDAPIDLVQYSLQDTTNNRTLQISPRGVAGYLLPDAHVVMAADGMVKDNRTTYRIDGWQSKTGTPAAVKTISVTREGYKSADITIKTVDTVWFRTYNTSSYSTSSSLSTDVFKGDTRSLFDDGLYVVPREPSGLEVSEVYAYASDCSPFDTSVLCGDYIELHNASSDSTIDLTDLVLRTDSSSSSRASSNTFTLDGELVPGDYLLVNHTDDGGPISLTNSGGYIWLEDAWGMVVPYQTIMTEWPSIPSSQQGYGLMYGDDGVWQWTTTPTPGAPNTLTVSALVLTVCPEGKYLNPDTGRCRTIEEAVSELAACEEGYERNPSTNRCRKIVAATSTLTQCAEGQERNPATNRCRKVQSTAIPAAPFAPAAVATEVPVWQWWMGGVIGAALIGYAVWEWRRELARVWQRVVKK